MKPPKVRSYKREWVVGNDVWTIKFTNANLEHRGKACDGLAHPDTDTIQIRTKMSKHDTMLTVIHELLHAIGFSYGIEELENDKLIEKLEEPIAKFMMDNF